MTILQLERFNKHIEGRFCDEEYQRKVAESAELCNLPIMDVYAKKLLTQLGCEAVPNRILIVKIAYLHGHIAGEAWAEIMRLEEAVK